MDAHAVLSKLARGEPLFGGHPNVSYRTIVGSESEYGVETKADERGKIEAVIDKRQLPVVLWNGGEVYDDGGHVEYASPEASNPVSAVAFYEAGKKLCWDAQYSKQLYYNNTDLYGFTFGSHESYFTSAPRNSFFRLIPFLIARSVMCGNGWMPSDGGFQISQRAKYIAQASGESTTADRGVINTREEDHTSKFSNWSRLHLILGDANMMEIASFLRFGTTSLMVNMLERNALPHIIYDEDYAALDIKSISRKTRDWYMAGIRSGPRSVVRLLNMYLDRAKKLFSHRDEVTDVLLIVWEDTLKQLSIDPMKLYRRLDWVAKLRAFELLKFSEGDGVTDRWLQSQDIQYHNLNPEEGLYFALRNSGEAERLVSDEFILQATVEPPPDTRAFVRGKLSRHFAQTGGELQLCTNNWAEICIAAKEQMGRGLRGKDQLRNLPVTMWPIEDPFTAYRSLLKRIRRTTQRR